MEITPDCKLPKGFEMTPESGRTREDCESRFKDLNLQESRMTAARDVLYPETLRAIAVAAADRHVQEILAAEMRKKELEEEKALETYHTVIASFTDAALKAAHDGVMELEVYCCPRDDYNQNMILCRLASHFQGL